VGYYYLKYDRYAVLSRAYVIHKLATFKIKFSWKQINDNSVTYRSFHSTPYFDSAIQTALFSVQSNPSLLKTLPTVAVFPHINVLLQTPERSSQPQLSTRPVRVSGTPKDLDSILWLCVCMCVRACVCACDLWRIKWHRDRFLFEYVIFPL